MMADGLPGTVHVIAVLGTKQDILRTLGSRVKEERDSSHQLEFCMSAIRASTNLELQAGHRGSRYIYIYLYLGSGRSTYTDSSPTAFSPAMAWNQPSISCKDYIQFYLLTGTVQEVGSRRS